MSLNILKFTNEMFSTQLTFHLKAVSTENPKNVLSTSKIHAASENDSLTMLALSYLKKK